MIEAIGDEGHAARRYVLNPVLFALVGDIASRAILDAGCTIRQVNAPTLTPEGIAVLGKQDRNLRIPNFIVISARKEVCG